MDREARVIAHIYIHIHTHRYTHTYIYILIHTHAHTYIHTHIHTHLPPHSHTLINTQRWKGEKYNIFLKKCGNSSLFPLWTFEVSVSVMSCVLLFSKGFFCVAQG